MEITKLCLWCEEFYFDNGKPDWSEYTPGEDAEMGCFKNIYTIYLTEDTLKKYRKCILLAENCEHYVQVEMEEEDTDEKD